MGFIKEKVFARHNQIIMVFMILMLLLGGRLLVLTVINDDDWVAKAEDQSIKSVYTSGYRGQIYDRNGVLLAATKSKFSVYMSSEGYDNKDLNRTSSNLIDILDNNNDKYIDDFPIKINNGKFTFIYDKEIAKWLKSENMPSDYTAEEAFSELRQRNDIADNLDKYDAQTELQGLGINPPISVARMEFSKDMERNMFYGQYGLDQAEQYSAKETFDLIRDYFEIDKSFSDRAARNVMVLRNQLASQGYQKYIPAKIASDVSEATVMQVEESEPMLPGASIVAESSRYYPQGKSAAHVLGYMGQISEARKEEYQSKGYNATEMVGLEGIEKSMESVLRGKSGVERIQVNKDGEEIAQIEKTDAEKGKDIFLTIDSRLQKRAETALADAIPRIRYNGVFNGKYGSYGFNDGGNAESGAVVAVEVKTGEPLAIANYPSFDPNLFAEGISDKDWDSLQSENPNDALAARPLYNIASLTAVQPGSTFKPMTAIAALQCGLSPHRYLNDAGYITVGNRDYRCLAYTRSKSTHGSVDLAHALQVSCNYYFYDIGSGYDYSANSSLGYDKKITIDVITKYAKQFGLGVKSDIEISESEGLSPTAESKMNNTKTLLRRYLISKSETYFTKEIANDEAKLLSCVDEIVSWTEENPGLEKLQDKMEDVGVRKRQSYNAASYVKYTYYNFAQWTTGDNLNISIGQGENSYTPLQMANYMATLGNGGTLNSSSLIKAQEGKGELKRAKGKKADLPHKESLSYVLDGMRRVVTGGTLSRGLAGLDVSVAGKTGTATRSGKVKPADEMKYMKENLGSINGSLSWSEVMKEADRLMKKYPNIYTSEEVAARKAIVNLSGKGFNEDIIDANKASYNDFAWVVALAPANDPEIAVACLVVQGGSSGNASPIVREVIGEYFDLKKKDAKKVDIDYVTFLEDN
jgi:penicillin-binding protein 2